MPRFKLRVEYAGTRYSGWQIQKNARTVQGTLGEAVVAATGERTFELYGAGRTDAGVHALNQIAHLDVRTTLPPESLRRRINEALPSDINVLAVDKAPHRFHARHDAVSRAYVYQIAQRRTAFAKPFVWWVKEPLDVDGDAVGGAALCRAPATFTGSRTTIPDEKSTARRHPARHRAVHGDVIYIVVEGSHFLWKMVRRMVGVLVADWRRGAWRRPPCRAARSPSGIPAKLTAPASGLFLARVIYPGDAAGPVPLPPFTL